MTLSLRGSTSILMSLSSRFVSDLDGCEAISWFGWLGGTRVIVCSWLSGWLVVSYRKSESVCDTCKVWVGVDVLINGGGVLLCFRDVVCDWCFVFDVCLVMGGDVRVYFCLE